MNDYKKNTLDLELSGCQQYKDRVMTSDYCGLSNRLMYFDEIEERRGLV